MQGRAPYAVAKYPALRFRLRTGEEGLRCGEQLGGEMKRLNARSYRVGTARGTRDYSNTRWLLFPLLPAPLRRTGGGSRGAAALVSTARCLRFDRTLGVSDAPRSMSWRKLEEDAALV